MDPQNFMTYEEALSYINQLMASLEQMNGTLSFLQGTLFFTLCLALGIGILILFYNFLKNFI